MKSSRGFAGALLFLSALPLALLYQMLAGHGGEIPIHFSFSLGSVLLCSAISDFRTPSWATWLGRLSIGLLAIIFALQGISELARNDRLTKVAYQGLGQQLEGWLLAGFLLWCMTAVLVDGHGKTKILGLFAVSSAAAVRAYASVLPLSGQSLETTAPVLKLVYLLPFVWLLAESRRQSSLGIRTLA
jgi:hypothetical protein